MGEILKFAANGGGSVEIKMEFMHCLSSVNFHVKSYASYASNEYVI